MYKTYSCYFMVLYGMLSILIFVSKLLGNMADISTASLTTLQIERVERGRGQAILRGFETTLEEIHGNERTIECCTLDPHYRIDLTDNEMEILCRIVQAEAGGEDMTGKILVADVVLNRVEHPSFPDNIEEVVFQSDNGVFQFSPINDGRYYEVDITEETRQAVLCALLEEDESGGALYFASRQHSSPENMSWFDGHLTYVEKYGGHEFFR